MKILNHAFHHVKAHCFKSTNSAVKLAHNMSKGKLREKDITYAKNLLSVKQSSLKPNSLKSEKRKLKYNALAGSLPINQQTCDSIKNLSHLKFKIAAVTNSKPNKKPLLSDALRTALKDFKANPEEAYKKHLGKYYHSEKPENDPSIVKFFTIYGKSKGGSIKFHNMATLS